MGDGTSSENFTAGSIAGGEEGKGGAGVAATANSRGVANGGRNGGGEEEKEEQDGANTADGKKRHRVGNMVLWSEEGGYGSKKMMGLKTGTRLRINDQQLETPIWIIGDEEQIPSTLRPLLLEMSENATKKLEKDPFIINVIEGRDRGTDKDAHLVAQVKRRKCEEHQGGRSVIASSFSNMHMVEKLAEYLNEDAEFKRSEYQKICREAGITRPDQVEFQETEEDRWIAYDVYREAWEEYYEGLKESEKKGLKSVKRKGCTRCFPPMEKAPRTEKPLTPPAGGSYTWDAKTTPPTPPTLCRNPPSCWQGDQACLTDSVSQFPSLAMPLQQQPDPVAAAGLDADLHIAESSAAVLADVEARGQNGVMGGGGGIGGSNGVEDASNGKREKAGGKQKRSGPQKMQAEPDFDQNG